MRSQREDGTKSQKQDTRYLEKMRTGRWPSRKPRITWESFKEDDGTYDDAVQPEDKNATACASTKQYGHQQQYAQLKSKQVYQSQGGREASCKSSTPSAHGSKMSKYESRPFRQPKIPDGSGKNGAGFVARDQRSR